MTFPDYFNSLTEDNEIDKNNPFINCYFPLPGFELTYEAFKTTV